MYRDRLQQTSDKHRVRKRHSENKKQEADTQDG